MVLRFVVSVWPLEGYYRRMLLFKVYDAWSMNLVLRYFISSMRNEFSYVRDDVFMFVVSFVFRFRSSRCFFLVSVEWCYYLCCRWNVCMLVLFCLEVDCELHRLNDSVFFEKNLKGFLFVVKNCEKVVIQINVCLKNNLKKKILLVLGLKLFALSKDRLFYYYLLEF